MDDVNAIGACGGGDLLGVNASNRTRLLRWYVSAATLNVPQAAGPIAFSLLALAMTGDVGGGAAMILAMTLAQVAGAVPITRLGRNLPPSRFLRLLVGFRTVALVTAALLAAFEVVFPWLVAFAALAGAVNGAAHGYLRSVLNRLVTDGGLPRALGISATLNELCFVLAPVAASGIGSLSPIVAVLVMSLLGAVPALLVPDIDAAPVDDAPHAAGSTVSPAILLWLACAAAGGAAVAAVEIGAVALALRFGYEPAFAILFTVPLCVASVAGGTWTSVRNRRASPATVVAQLSTMSLGAVLAALGTSVAATVAGAVLVGSVLAPLATHYSLALDGLAPPSRRAEVFALLRTANAVGVIVASLILALFSVASAMVAVAGLMVAVTSMVALISMGRRRDGFGFRSAAGQGMATAPRHRPKHD